MFIKVVIITLLSISLGYLLDKIIYHRNSTLMDDKMAHEYILVTGGAGYIGSHTVLELLNSGFEVVVIDNLSNAFKGKGVEKPECLNRVEKITKKKITFIECDITNKDALSDLFSKYKFYCVIHFAALKAVGESVQIPLEYYKINVAGTLNLLETMREFNVKRFIYSSSATVYGVPEKLPLIETMKTGNCTNPYGKTKFMVEEILKDLSISAKEWSIISLRYFNPVGAHPSGQIGEDPNGIPNNLMPFIAQVSVGKREKLSVYGNDYDTPDGTGVRDYIHIMDLASGHVKALIYQKEKNPLGFQAINLGSGRGYSVLEIIEAYEKASGKKIPYDIVDRRPGDIASSYADATLSKQLLGWIAEKDVNDMCADTWNWQQHNPNGYDVKQ